MDFGGEGWYFKMIVIILKEVLWRKGEVLFCFLIWGKVELGKSFRYIFVVFDLVGSEFFVIEGI